VSQITTLGSSFADDLRTYADAGLDGIGIWELKLPEGDDAEALERFRASGLDSAAAVPVVPSILPLPLLGGPEDPAERVESYCRSLERLAPFEPACTVLLTGTGDRDVAVEGLRTVAAEAERLAVVRGAAEVSVV
jgi:sugar phosphate isomerase/epimerase